MKKKWTIIIILLIVILYIIINNNIITNNKYKSNNSKEYIITATGNKNSNSNGSEIRILSIIVDGNTMNLEELKNGDFLYQDGQLIGLAGSKLFLNIEVDKNVQILFLKHQWSGIVEIDSGNDMVTQDLYSEFGDAWCYGTDMTVIELILSEISSLNYVYLLVIFLLIYILIKI